MTEPNDPLVYAPGLEPHHLIMSKLGEHTGQYKRDIVLLSPLVDQETGFGQVTMLQMNQKLFNSYGATEKINLKENW